MSNDAHTRSTAEPEELLYDPDVPTPTHGDRARTLVAGVSTGTLCTIAKEPVGYPYGSFVTFAIEGSSPVFFISTLAEHTRNLGLDKRASLLVAEGGEGDPLANGRVTMIGTCRMVPDGEERERVKVAYLNAHPNARYYIDYADFAFWRLEVEAVRYIGGYGRMSWVDISAWNDGLNDAIAPHTKGIIEHMNADHADALVTFCHAFSKASDATEATMTGVDRYGFEMSVMTAKGQRPVRLAFSRPVETADEVRREMVEMVARARSNGG